MKIIFLLLAAAVLAPAVMGSDVAVGDWREQIIARLQEQVIRVQERLESLPEDSPMRRGLERLLQYLQNTLDRLRGEDVAFEGEVFQREFLERMLQELEQRIQDLPEGSPIRRLIEQQIANIRRLLDRLPSEESFVSSDRIRDLVNRIRQLIGEAREQGSEALLRLLTSDRLESLVSQLPPAAQAGVRALIQRLIDGISEEEEAVVAGADWRERLIAQLIRKIEALEARIEELPEDSPIRAYLERMLQALQERLERLQGESSFGSEDRIEFLRRALVRLEARIAELPEDSPRRSSLERRAEYLRRVIDRLSESEDDAALEFSADWREKAIAYLIRVISRLEQVIERLPEDSRLRSVLARQLDYLRRRLSDLQDASFRLGSGECLEMLRQVLARVEAAIASLPEGLVRSALERQVALIRRLIERLSSGEESFALDDRVRQVLNRIRELIQIARGQGREALLRLLSSDRLDTIVSQLPPRVQAVIRAKIQGLVDRISQ